MNTYSYIQIRETSTSTGYLHMLRVSALSIAVAVGGLAGAGMAKATGLDDFGPNGLKLRGDGTVDDTQPRARAAVSAPRGVNDIGPNGLKLRGDGTVDDNQARARGLGRPDLGGLRGNRGRSERLELGNRGSRDRAERIARGERLERGQRGERVERNMRVERGERSNRIELGAHGGR
jgi:hypothetical protein